MSAGAAGTEPATAKKVEEAQGVLADARKRKEAIKKEYFAFVEDMARSIAGERNALLDAQKQAEFLSGGFGSEGKIERIKSQLANLEKEVEKRRLDDVAKIQAVEVEIKAAEEQVEVAFRGRLKASSSEGGGAPDIKQEAKEAVVVKQEAKEAVANKPAQQAAVANKPAQQVEVNREQEYEIAMRERVEKASKLLEQRKGDAEAAVRKAEKAYKAGNTAETIRVLATAQAAFDSLSAFPDSQAKAESLSGRLYDLKKCIDTGAEYRTGKTTGTDLITRPSDPKGTKAKGGLGIPGVGWLRKMITRVVELRQNDQQMLV